LVELVRDGIDAVNRRDLDALMSNWSPDVVYDTSPSGMGTYQGHAAVRAFMKGYWDLFDELRFELESVENLGHGVILSVNRQDGRPAGSGARVRVREAHVITLVADVVLSVTVYTTDIGAARAAAERLAEERSRQSAASPADPLQRCCGDPATAARSQ
jgi:ketosteroid isomerase-like protein